VHRQSEALDIVVEIFDDLGQGHESAGVTPAVFGSRQPDLKIRRHEGERIPALIPPGVRNCGRSLQHNVLAPLLFKVKTDGKTSLTTANDNRIRFIQDRFLL
jgi:hypothetical protein